MLDVHISKYTIFIKFIQGLFLINEWCIFLYLGGDCLKIGVFCKKKTSRKQNN